MHICIFGDSITWGACDYKKGGWVERLKIYFLEHTDNVEVYNLGVSDDDSNSLLKRFKTEATARDPQQIVFAVGINDSQYIQTNNPRVGLEKFTSNVSELIKQAKKFTKKIIFVGLTKVDESKTMPIPWNKTTYYKNERIAQYNATLKEVCKAEGLVCVEVASLLKPKDLEDGLHPNTQGHEKIFEKMREILEKNI